MIHKCTIVCKLFIQSQIFVECLLYTRHYSRFEIIKLWAKGQIQPAAYFYIADEPRMNFTFLNGLKTSKEE